MPGDGIVESCADPVVLRGYGENRPAHLARWLAVGCAPAGSDFTARFDHVRVWALR